ncbi:hypothetical protein Zmor_016749 [Zophobas morio]|uniref:Uncharacterized protein n=1 Tax=Zophobas morio TaxID=2755281 RepID=A0AA38MBX4_9CUCU|nr:hypothetical protein Zmor_016749 [Zophobas morio]
MGRRDASPTTNLFEDASTAQLEFSEFRRENKTFRRKLNRITHFNFLGNVSGKICMRCQLLRFIDGRGVHKVADLWGMDTSVVGCDGAALEGAPGGAKRRGGHKVRFIEMTFDTGFAVRIFRRFAAFVGKRRDYAEASGDCFRCWDGVVNRRQLGLINKKYDSQVNCFLCLAEINFKSCRERIFSVCGIFPQFVAYDLSS